MSSSYKVNLDNCLEQVPKVASLTSIMRMGGKPFSILGRSRIWRIHSGEWYKTNGLGRLVMIDKKIHHELDAIIRSRKIKTVYGTEFRTWRKIKIDFIQEITR